MSRFFTRFCIGLLSLVGSLALAQDQKPLHVDIAAQPAGDALNQFAEQSGLQLVFYADDAEGIEVAAVAGEFEDASLALDTLLASTGLEYAFINDRTVAVAAANQDEAEDPGNARTAPRPVMMAQASKEEERRTEDDQERPDSGVVEKQDRQIEEIVITGTRIKGTDVSSSVVTIMQEEMRLSGHNNLGDVIRALPQNFPGGQNPGVLSGATAGGQSNQNVTGGSSFNLRGLGPDATLVLLNGTRLPYDGFFQATDVSVIPVAAIDRVEVLLDGASAIYGSDAVGGVANIVLKRHYQGAEISTRFGAATDGGYEQQQYTALAGHSWDSGGFLITGDFSKNTEVRAQQRDYLGHLPNQNDTLYPASSQKGVLFSGQQELGDLAQLTLDAFYTARQSEETSDRSSIGSVHVETDRDSATWGVSSSLRFDLSEEWTLRILGSLGRNGTDRRTSGFTAPGGALVLENFSCFCNKVEAGGVEAEGLLFTLAGGEARLSVGGGWRKNTFDRISRLSGATTLAGVDSSYYGFGEINLPLVSEDQGIPLVNGLRLNGALRHEAYDSFGEATTPKFGAIWSLAPGFDIKASWGRSYKVPTLFQQHSALSLFLFPAAIAGGAAIGAPDDAMVMNLSGGNPDLGPERAEIVTVGFVARPEVLPGFSLQLGWFDVDYSDRVVVPITPFAQAFNPAFAGFVTFDPTVVQQDAAFAVAGLPVGTFNFNLVPYDPAEVIAIIDTRYTNAAAQRMRGIDLAARYTTALFDGHFTASGNGHWIMEATRRLTSLSAELPAAGVVFLPAKFKGRLGASWSREGLTLSSSVNHTVGVTDTIVTPNVKRGSMTTLDLVIDYQTESDLVGDVGFNLAVTNLLNERPPFMQPANPVQVNYDSTNYSPLGRVVSATITKRF